MRMPTLIHALAALLLCLCAALPAAAEDPGALPALLAELHEAGFRDKQQVIERIVALRHPNTRVVLRALLDGQLVVRKSDGTVFIAADDSGAQALTDPQTLDPAGRAAADEVERIRTNNALRKYLRGTIAQFALADPQRKVRLAAARELIDTLDDDVLEILRRRAEVETDDAVLEQIGIALALAALDSGDPQQRLDAVQTLAGSLHPTVYNRLSALADAEADPQLRAAASRAVHRIDGWRRVCGWIETLFFGLSLGSVLVLAAIGLAITFGVMGVINMAHGELMMIGAYTTYCVQLLLPQHLGLSIALSIPAAFLVAGAFGVAIERGIVRFLYGRPLETLLATFGLSLILQQLVRSIFSPLNRSVATPEFMSGTLAINEALSLTYNRLYIVVFALIVFVLLQLVLKRTPLGLQVRAVAQNRAMARAMGIRSEWVDAATFGLGAGIAGVAGVALSQLTNVGPNLGQSYIIDSFMVVVFGGVGNLWGTLISGLSLGVINKLLEPYSGAVLAKILVLVFLILFIQRRPRGLFPQKGRAAEGL
ncbi:MAG: urea ABC transporter permease subunit UrtB [Gammaproteobacteria bacterium]